MFRAGSGSGRCSYCSKGTRTAASTRRGEVNGFRFGRSAAAASASLPVLLAHSTWILSAPRSQPRHPQRRCPGAEPSARADPTHLEAQLGL